MLLTLLRARSTLVWMILVVATLASWALGSEHRIGSEIGVVVLAIGLIKVRFVGLDFMELRNAPLALRAIFETYCVALWCILAGMYLWL
jgi:hypothetical protein